jgi:hypothetical protein
MITSDLNLAPIEIAWRVKQEQLRLVGKTTTCEFYASALKLSPSLKT